MMNLRDYRAFAGMQDRHFLVGHLTSLHAPPWEGLDQQSFKTCYSEIKLALAGDLLLVQLLDLHLLAHCLIAGNRTPGWVMDIMHQDITPENLFAGVERRAFLDGRWTGVPVPMVAADSGRIRWFVVGAVVGSPRCVLWPEWATPLMDNDSQSAIMAAAQAACKISPSGREISLFLFPLAMANDCCQFHGTSLALPLAIGFMQVLTGETISSRLIATGALGKKGTVGSVDGLSEKRDAAGRQGFSLFIYPAASHPLPAVEHMETLHATNLQQAWMFARWYRPGNGNRLNLLSQMTHDAHTFVNNMNSIDTSWISHLAAQGRLTPVIQDIVASPDLFSRFVSNIEQQLDAWRLDDARICLSAVNSPPLSHAFTSSPLSAFRYFKAALALSNHRGDVEAAEAAATDADRLFSQAMQGDLNLCADYLNHRQVARHNRFQFDPEIGHQLKRVLKVLEARHRVQCESGCPTDTILAEIYGTITQNYGFCGPTHLTGTIRYAGKAIEAFGSGEVSEYRQDVRRQHAHLMYAYLDARDIHAARESLFAFLAVADWDQVDQKCKTGQLTRWHHAALARFLADAGDRKHAIAYLKWCQPQATVMKAENHPRQLWSCNLGRMARWLGQIDAAKTFFHECLNLCMANANHPTLFVMALLPLAALDGRETAAADNTLIKVIETARRLNPDHFKDLLNVDEKTLLERFRTAPERFFPFSYR